MPDQFGQETPQEAVARVQQTFNSQRENFNRSALASNPYALLGQSLGNIFGGTIRKTIDTRQARQTEAYRLVDTTGMSVQEAREVAKETVPRDFREVRAAKKRQAAAKVAEDTFSKLSPIIGVERAQAAAETVMAAQLRRQGFAAEATAMTMQADARLKAEEQRQLGVRKAKAEVTTAENTAIESFMDIERYNEQPIEALSLAEERLRAKIEASDNLDDIAGWERTLAAVQGRKTMLITRSLSDADERALTRGADSKIQLDILDSQLLDQRFALLDEMIGSHEGELSATTLGRWGANVASNLEGFFGLDPGTYGADTLVSDVAEFKSFPAFASSQLRHALTGAAMSAQEQPLMEPFLPTPGDSPTVMRGKIAAVRAYTQLDIEVRQEFVRAMAESEGKEIPPALSALMRRNQEAFMDNEIAAQRSQDVDPNVTSGIAIIDEVLKQQGGGNIGERNP